MENAEGYQKERIGEWRKLLFVQQLLASLEFPFAFYLFIFIYILLAVLGMESRALHLPGGGSILGCTPQLYF
jgi:hypothetical protein